MATAVMKDDAAKTVFRLSTGVHASAFVRAAVQLGLPDAVGDAPVAAEPLAEAIGADRDVLARFLRLLTTFGIFAEAGSGKFEHTELSRALRSDAPDGVADVIRLGGDWNWVLWGRLADSIRTGKGAFAQTFGKDIFRYFAEDDPEAGAAFQRGLAVVARRENPLVAAALPLRGTETVIDIGGGNGSLLLALRREHPGLQAVLFETEQALDTAGAGFRQILGDCHQEAPGGGDVYLIKQTLHMWDDETALRVLRNIARAAPPGARVVVVEQVLTGQPGDEHARLMDMHMLLVAGGRERTEEEFAGLFTKAGLEPRGVTGRAGDLRLIEAVVPA